MTGRLVVAVVEVLGCLLSAGYAVPQLVRRLATRKVYGLSGPALVVAPLASPAWIGYFAWQARYGVLVSGFLYLPSELLVVAALVRSGGRGPSLARGKPGLGGHGVAVDGHPLAAPAGAGGVDPPPLEATFGGG